MSRSAAASARLWSRLVERGPWVAAAVAVLVFLNSLDNGFAYDDVHILVENETIQDVRELPGLLVRPYWPGAHGGDLGLWRPVTTALFGVQHALWGLDPMPYHLVNVLLHGLATALVVLLLGRLLPPPAALVGGLVFAVHPVHVEAVANVVGVAEILPAVLYLAACLAAIRSWDRPGSGPVILACVLYALAFLSKESAVTLPAAVVLLDGARRRIPLRDLGGYLRKRGSLLGGLALTAAAVLTARFLVLGSLADPDPALGADLLTEIPRIWTLGVIWAEYLRLFLFPTWLSADYAPDVVPLLTVWRPRNVLGVAAVLALLAAGLVGWRSARLDGSRLSWAVLGFGVVWVVVTISPVSNVLFVSGVLVAERTLYLPSVGVAAVMGAGLVALARFRIFSGVALSAALLLFFSIRTWTRTPVWDDTFTVFAHMIVDQPESGRSQWVLGDMRRGQGREAEAREAYRKAVGLLDRSYRLLVEVGWDAAEAGDERLGEFLLRQAWMEHPELAGAPRRLAILYTRQGRHADAARLARAALEATPHDVATWHLLAGALTAVGRWPEAAAARERVLAEGESAYWQQWLSLARLRLTAGDTTGARAALDSALARAPHTEVEERIEAAFVPLPRPEPTLADSL